MNSKSDSNSVLNNSPDINSQNGKNNQFIEKISNDTNQSQNKQIAIAQKPNLTTVPATKSFSQIKADVSYSWKILTAIALMGIGLVFNIPWLGWIGTLATFLFSLPVILPLVKNWLNKFLPPQERKILVGFTGFFLASAVLLEYAGFYRRISNWLGQFQYDEFGSWAEWIGAVGQISIAIVAVYVAWRQYVISKALTIQQNRITQQQTIDAYFQGIADLTVNDQGLLEDWPQERAIAEARTAVILSSVDAGGKGKILRFLSQARLVTPLKRDSHLGRPILDGAGGYAEDRAHGLRVIDLGVILASTDLSYQDLRWTDLSEANMVRTNLSHCDLVKANLSRTILYEANLTGADLKGSRLFYGKVETASPRSRNHPPNYETGAYTGVVIEKANLTEVQRLSEEQHYYLCAWGGEKTRATIPGGCEGIPNQLGR